MRLRKTKEDNNKGANETAAPLKQHQPTHVLQCEQQNWETIKQ